MQKIKVAGSELQSTYRVLYREKKNWEKYTTKNGTIQKCLNLENGIEYSLISYDKPLNNVIKVINELDHPNIFQVHEIFESCDYIDVVFQHFDGISIFEELQSRECKRMNDPESCELVSQIISVSRYLIRNKYISGYPTLDNILINKNSLGYSLRFTDLYSPILFTRSGHFVDHDWEKYALFYTGLIAYSLVSGIFPVIIKGAEYELMHSILNHEIFLNLTSNCRDFISTCFSSFKLSHVNIETIQRHPWLNFSDRFSKPILSSSYSLMEKYPMRSLLSRIFRLSLSNSIDYRKLENFRYEFLKFDHQGFGEITCHDFLNSFQNISKTFASEIFTAINIKRTGCISYHEFIAALLDNGDVTEINLQITFKQLCGPNQSTIKVADIGCNLIENYSTTDIINMYTEVGLTVNSIINFEEFLKLLGFYDNNGTSTTTTTTTLNNNSSIIPRKSLSSVTNTESSKDGLPCNGQSVEVHVIENVNKDINSIYFIDAYSILGSGISGDVVKCRHRISGIQYALKVLDKRNLSANSLSDIQKEIRIMSQLDHPNILKLHEWFETEDKVYLILNLCTGGELLERLNDQPNHRYPEEIACKLVYDIVGAVRYCHDNKIAHRDLKLENFLLENQSDDASIKLIDFGLSCYFTSSQYMTECIGTPYYVAPEVLGKRYNENADMWSIGVIAYMLMTGTPLFNGDDDSEILKQVARGRVQFDTYFDTISEAGKDFVKRCLTKNPLRRMSAKDAQSHAWFATMSQRHKIIPYAIIHNLQTFSLRNPLSRLLFLAVARTQKSENLVEIRNLFHEINTSKSGEISIEEFRVALKKQGSFHDNEIDVLFSSMDVEVSGRLKYHQFIAATLTVEVVKENQWKSAFYLLSHNKDYITAKDIRDMVGQIATENMMEQLLVNYPNQSCRITFSDFQDIIHKKCFNENNSNSNSKETTNNFPSQAISTESHDLRSTSHPSSNYYSRFKQLVALNDRSGNAISSPPPTTSSSKNMSLLPIIENSLENLGRQTTSNTTSPPTSLFVKKEVKEVPASTGFITITSPTLSPLTPTTVATESSPHKTEALAAAANCPKYSYNLKYKSSGVESRRWSSKQNISSQVKECPLILPEAVLGSSQVNAPLSSKSNGFGYGKKLLSKQSPNKSPIRSAAKHYPSNLKITTEVVPTPVLPVAFPPRKGSLQNRTRPSPSARLLSRQLSSDR